MLLIPKSLHVEDADVCWKPSFKSFGGGEIISLKKVFRLWVMIWEIQEEMTVTVAGVRESRDNVKVF